MNYEEIVEKMSSLSEISIEKQYARYTSQHILGMIGISAYVLADTYFISRCAGADGIAGLNLVIPVYSMIFAIGELLGVGGATRFTIDSARNDAGKDAYFRCVILWAVLLSLPFTLIGAFCPASVPAFFGGDERLIEVITPYTRLIMLFTPFFMISHILTAFVRNDGAPRTAMLATLSSNLFNIIFDWVFIFPMKLGMTGAALATIIAPVLAICIDVYHIRYKNSSIRWSGKGIAFKRMIRSAQLGISAFIGELAGGVVTMVFNFLILGLVGNTGVAAYGIICNVAIIGSAVFNGTAQGGQPLLSHAYGIHDEASVKKVYGLAIRTSVAFALIIEAGMLFFGKEIVQIFNSEGNLQLAAYAVIGIKLYFAGYLFSGINMVATAYLSAVEQPMRSFILSMCRGVVLITICGILMARLFGMTGVWLSYAAAEALTLLIFLWMEKKRKRA